MRAKKRLFIYPNTSETYRQGGNSYIRNLIFHLNGEFSIVNRKTTIGLLDVLLKLPKSDIIYFNWIEDIPDRRFGFLQVPLLAVILFLAKVSNIKMVWFIHNNVSHSRKHVHLKNFIVRMMRSAADVILSHSNELKLDIDRNKFHVFDHPVDPHQPLVPKQPYKYNLLVWGTVSPYKGVDQFIDYVSKAQDLHKFQVLIAGKFQSEAYYEDLKNRKPANVTLVNKILSEEELAALFAECRYVLFTYNSPSVLSSAALCKTLSFGKEVIGPGIGAFKELGRKKLLYNYDSFASLEKLMYKLESGEVTPIDKDSLAHYIESVSWNNFARFLSQTINNSLINTKR
jgi:beta-1,4-mannosyltransferase